MTRDLRVCFVGDSFVAGQGDATALGWVGRVAAAGLAAGLPLTAYNLGIRGDTSVLVADRVAAEAAPRLAPADDPRLIVSFGANDTVLVEGRQRCTTAETLAALDRIRALPFPVLLVGPPAVADEPSNARIGALNEHLRAAGLPFVDAFAATVSAPVWRDAAQAGDGYHPDADGYALLAEALQGPLLAWLRRRDDEPPEA